MVSQVLQAEVVNGQTRIKIDKDKWTSICARNGEPLLIPRMPVSEIASSLEKKCANEMDWVIDAMVSHAMKYALQVMRASKM